MVGRPPFVLRSAFQQLRKDQVFLQCPSWDDDDAGWSMNTQNTFTNFALQSATCSKTRSKAKRVSLVSSVLRRQHVQQKLNTKPSCCPVHGRGCRHSASCLTGHVHAKGNWPAYTGIAVPTLIQAWYHAFGFEAGSSRAVAGSLASFGKILRLLAVQSPAALAAACAWRASAQVLATRRSFFPPCWVLQEARQALNFL